MTILYVKWRDACRQDGEWRQRNLAAETIMESVGILILPAADENYISIAQDKYLEPGSGELTWCGILHIPLGMILEQRELSYPQGPAQFFKGLPINITDGVDPADYIEKLREE